MKKKNNNDDEYRFEERDDERTFGEGLISDLEAAEQDKLEKAEAWLKEYISEFYQLINSCGQVSYYSNMRHFVQEEQHKAKLVAASYEHDLAYYKEQEISWVAKARRGLAVLKFKASLVGYDFEEEDNTFLNNLALSKDRRESYKYYLAHFKKNGKIYSPDELEYKYIQRIMKRKKK